MRYIAMNHLVRLPYPALLVLLALLFLAKAVLAEPYKAEPGPYRVASQLLELQDAERDRDVPVKVYRPVDAEGPRPVVLVSHGLGGTREGLSYLGKHWASHGYVCVHMQHIGSDDAVWKDVKASQRLQAMRRAANNPANAINRALDTTFVLDELTRLNADERSKLAGKLDMSKAAIAGHSFGAWTCMAAGGMTLAGQRGTELTDDRIRCMIPLSPPVVAREREYERTYKTLRVPALFMTGTLDTTSINDTTAEARQAPYNHMPGASKGGAAKYLINFDGADHMTFSGETRMNRRLRRADPKTDPVFHGLILQSTTAFLDTYLGQDEDAKRWLNGEGFAAVMAGHGVLKRDAGLK